MKIFIIAQMRNFQRLNFWIKSHELTLKVYKATLGFPREELFGLTSQMRRSSASIPTNIAEGCGRDSITQLKRFFTIASGSCSELQYQLLLAKDLKYISESIYKELHQLVTDIRKMNYKYIASLALADSR